MANEREARMAESSDKTPWFPGDVKPVHIGPYEREDRNGTAWFSCWNGHQWCFNNETPEGAAWNGCRSLDQDLPWRGLTSPSQAQEDGNG